MAEVAGIIVVVIALFIGLWIQGWAFGDFERPRATGGPQGQPGAGSSAATDRTAGEPTPQP
jgi:hypothetical protein